ncbi:cytidine deaminase, partial [Nocardia sp. NPDC005745]
MQRAYAPYSRFPVGAAGLTDSGVVTGCNVENVS